MPVLDSLREPHNAEDGPLTDGIRLTRDNLLDALQAEGVTPIEVGSDFDPNVMEALTTLPASEEQFDGTVIQTLESG